jgi:hypothetical protein
MKALRLWFLSTAIALDRFANAVLNGSCDETLSSRAARMRDKQQPVWGWTADAIDAGARLFGVADHCRKSLTYEAGRWNPACPVDTAGRPLTDHMKA